MEKLGQYKRYIQFLALTIFVLYPLQAQERKTLAVLEFDNFGLSTPEVQILTNRLRTNIAMIGTFHIIERGSMNQILEEQDFQSTGCTSDECAVEIGELLGVQYMLAGSVGKIGGLYSFDIRIIDVQTGGLVKTAAKDLRGEIDYILSEGMRMLAEMITSEMPIDVATTPEPAPVQPPTPAVGVVDFVTSPRGAELTIDGQARGSTPALRVQLEPDVSHSVQLRLDGYQPVDTSLTVSAGIRRGPLRIDLDRLTGWLTINSNVPATVSLNRKRIGKTPLRRLNYGTGEYALKATSPEYFPFKGTVFIPANNETKQDIVLGKKPTAPALALSVAVPGAGQIYMGRVLKGIIFLAAIGGLGQLANNQHQAFLQNDEDFKGWRNEYNNEDNLEQMLLLKQRARTSYDASVDNANGRNLLLAGVGLLWGYNIIDVAF